MVLVVAGFCACLKAQSINPVLAGGLNTAGDSIGINSVRLYPAGTDSTALAWQSVPFDQIKVFTHNLRAFKGSLVSMTWNSLTINNGWEAIPVERSAVRSIELYRRDASGGVFRGALLGTAIGVVVFTFINVGDAFSHIKIMSYGEPEEVKLVAVWTIPACTIIGSVLGLSHRKKVATFSPDDFWGSYQH